MSKASNPLQRAQRTRVGEKDEHSDCALARFEAGGVDIDATRTRRNLRIGDRLQFLPKPSQQPLLNPVAHPHMLDELEILPFRSPDFHEIRWGCSRHRWPSSLHHRRARIDYTTCSCCRESRQGKLRENARKDEPLSSPKSNRLTAPSPKRHRKYHETAESDVTSVSAVTIPRESNGFNRSGSGNGSRAVRVVSGAFRCVKERTY